MFSVIKQGQPQPLQGKSSPSNDIPIKEVSTDMFELFADRDCTRVRKALLVGCYLEGNLQKPQSKANVQKAITLGSFQWRNC